MVVFRKWNYLIFCIKVRSNKVCNFACFYVRNKQVSEDITMDAFLQLLETMKVESVDNPMALLITIVKHKSLDYLKTQVRRENTKDDLIQWKQRELAIRNLKLGRL